MAQKPHDSFACGGIFHSACANECWLVEKTDGIQRPRHDGRCWIHGPRQLGDRSCWWCAIWICTSLSCADLQLDGDLAATFVSQTWSGCRTRFGASLPRSLWTQDFFRTLGFVRNCNRSMRSCRSHRFRHRTESALWNPPCLGSHHHCSGCADDSRTAKQGLARHRNNRCGTCFLNRRLLHL